MSPLSPRTRAIAAALALVLAALAGLAFPRLPAPAAEGAPATAFSSARALAHLAVIARRPHRIGSPEHARVRGEIMERLHAIGLTPEVHESVVVQRGYGAPIFATVRNVVARRKGTGSGKALLMVAHYDTRSMAPGASDDGYGVATLLETMRALAAGGPLASDVIALFTDGEEEGLLGAHAFVTGDPWARDVGLVLNFEARGDAGPALMFQTGNDNGALIRALAAAVPQPAANSLSQAVYRRMPNGTDLNEWLPRTPALNFANIEGFARYHAPTDTVENADEGTLQHHGEQALALARAFAGRAIPPPPEPDATYFDAGPFFVVYPGAWDRPLAAAPAVLLAIFVAAGALRRALRPGRAILAILAALVAVVLAAGGAAVLSTLVESVHPAHGLFNAARPALKGLHLAAVVAFAVAVVLGAVAWLGHRLRPAELFTGGAGLFVALAPLAAAYLPGGAFLFTWPALIALGIGLVLVIAGGFESDAPPAVLLQIAVALPAIVLVGPYVPQLWDAFGPTLAVAPAAVTALVAMLAAPALRHLIAPGVRTPVTAIVASLALFAAAALVPAFDRGHPQPDTLFFAVDADAGRAFWVSPDRTPDAWTTDVLAHAVQQPRVPLPFTFAGGGAVLVSEVGKVAEPGPEIRWMGEREGSRVRARVVPPPGAEVLAVRVEGPVGNVVVAGKTAGAAFRFYAPPADGVELEVTTTSAGPITIHAVSQRPGFPATATPQPGPRPAGLMAKPGMLPPWDDLLESDMTIVARTASR